MSPRLAQPRHQSQSPARRNSLSKLVFSVDSFPFLEFDLLLKGKDMLLVDKVYEFEMFVEHAAIVLDALLEIGDAHILVTITLQCAQEGLFSEASDVLRYATESLEPFWGGRLPKFYTILFFPKYSMGCGARKVKRFRTGEYKEVEQGEQGRIIDIDVRERRRCNSWVPLSRCARCSSSRGRAGGATLRLSCCQAACLSGLRAKADML